MEILLAICINLLSDLAWWIGSRLASTRKRPVLVSPHSIRFRVGEWKAKTLFKLYNRSDSPIYLVVLKLRIDGPGICAEDISITPHKLKNELVGKVGTISVNTDIIRFNGSDKSGSEAVLLMLCSLDPGEIRTFTLASELPCEARGHVWLRVVLDVLRFEKEPSQVQWQSGRMAIQFKVPEDFVVRSQAMLMKS